MEGGKYPSSEDQDAHQTVKVKTSEITGAHLRNKFKTFTECSLRELAATSYLRGHMDLIIALAMTVTALQALSSFHLLPISC